MTQNKQVWYPDTREYTRYPRTTWFDTRLPKRVYPIPEYSQNKQVWYSGTQEKIIPISEFDQNNQVWYLGIPEYVPYSTHRWQSKHATTHYVTPPPENSHPGNCFWHLFVR